MTNVAQHAHEPLFRVIRAKYSNPLDPSYGRSGGGRWNAPHSFDVLYTCCSLSVARAVAFDRLRQVSIELEDLAASERPELVSLTWSGSAVYLTTNDDLSAVGLPAYYPFGAEHGHTQPLGAQWYTQGQEAVVVRSASLARGGFTGWTGDHRHWSELAIFVDNAAQTPTLISQHSSQAWMLSAPRPNIVSRLVARVRELFSLLVR